MLLEHVDIEVTRNLFLCIEICSREEDRSKQKKRRKKKRKEKEKKKEKGLPARGHLQVKIREGKEEEV